MFIDIWLSSMLSLEFAARSTVITSPFGLITSRVSTFTVE